MLTCDLLVFDQSKQPIKPLVTKHAAPESQRHLSSAASRFNLQRLQVGEATEGPVCDEADTVASDMELLEQAEAGEAGLLQPGKMVGGQVAVKAKHNEDL